MPLTKTSTHANFRLPIKLKEAVDVGVDQEETSFSQFVREGIKMKLESLGIVY